MLGRVVKLQVKLIHFFKLQVPFILLKTERKQQQINVDKAMRKCHLFLWKTKRTGLVVAKSLLF